MDTRQDASAEPSQSDRPNRHSLNVRSRTSLLATLAVSLASIYLGFFAFDTRLVLEVMKWASVPLVFLALGLFGYHGTKLIRRHLDAIKPLYKNKAFLIAVPVATVGLMANHPLGYKTVMDEVLLAGTARQISFNNQPFVATTAIPEKDGLKVRSVYADKRALVYPGVVALVHHLTGYRTTNAFYVNVAATVLILVLLWGIGYRLAGAPGGIFGVFLAATLPLMGMMGTGAGFEVLNLLFILFFFLGLYALFLRTDKTSIAFLCATTVLLAQIRYESVLFVIPAAIAIVVAWWLRKKIIIPLTLILSAPLLLNVGWQREIFESNPKAYQLASRPGKEAVFSLEYVPDNLGHALYFFLGAHPSLPNSLPLFVIGAPCLVVVLLRLRKWLGPNSPGAFEKALGITVICLIVHFGLMMSYFWGQFDDPVIFRLSLPTWLLFWLASVATLAVALRSRFRDYLIGSLIFSWVILSLPTYANHSYSKNHWSVMNFEAARKWSSEHREKNYLFLSHFSLFWIIENQAAIDASGMEKFADILKRYLETDSFDEILTFRFKVPEGDPLPKSAPGSETAFEEPEGLLTEPFYEWNQPLLGGFEMRRVTGLDPEWLEKHTGADVVADDDGEADNEPLPEGVETPLVGTPPRVTTVE